MCPSAENPDLVFQEPGFSKSLTHSRPNVVADKLSRLGQTIQTEWSLLPEVFHLICNRWHQPQLDLFATRFNNNKNTVCLTGPRTPGLGSRCTKPTLGRSGPISLPTSSHLGQSGRKVAGLPVQENHSDCSRVACLALLGI